MMGQIYGNRWEIVNNLTGGGQGEIYQVRDLHDENKSERWILKRLKKIERSGRFSREIAILKSLKSPYIVPIEDYSEDYSKEKSAYIVTPNLGSNLENYLKQTNPSLSIGGTLQLFEQIVSGIQEAHSNHVAHRDIKPDNIVVNENATVVSIIDFGISYFELDDAILTLATEPFGNPAFSAPECFLGRTEEPRFAADIYSLGKLLYWMVSGGNYIHREYLVDHVLNKIQSDHWQIRFYIERLLRGTIREQINQRWDASTLLQQVQMTIALINRYESYLQNGKYVLYDSFGLNDSYNSFSSRSATMPPQGNPPSDGDVGMAFTAPQEKDLKLESLTLALKLINGVNRADIWILKDKNNKPNNEEIIESFALENPISRSGSELSVYSSNQPTLMAGKYWLVISVPMQDTNMAWLSAPLDFMPLKALIAERYNMGDWEVRESPSGPGYALRILASQ